MQIEVYVPPLLQDCTGNQVVFMLEADTVQGALTCLFEMYPLLRYHLYNEEGELRQHVLLYYNDENIAGMEDLNVPIRAGDRLLVLQAVSGG